jgi:hypothetical protein
LYKTSKEEFDLIERKFTQMDIDRMILRYMAGHGDSLLKKESTPGKFLKDFKNYIDKKEKEGVELKFEGKKLKPEYHHLSLKLEAIEKTIVAECGQRGLRRIKALYEHEMRRKIMEAQKHS